MHTNEQPRQSGYKQELMNASSCLCRSPMGLLKHLFFGELLFSLAAKQQSKKTFNMCSGQSKREGGNVANCLAHLHSHRKICQDIFDTIHKESHSWRMRAREVAWTQSGIRTERRGTRRHRELKTHWGGGAGLSATKLGVVRPWELITSSTPTSPRLFFFFFFAPFLPTTQKKWTNSTLLGFFPPSLKQHKQMHRRLANWFGLRVEVPPGPLLGFFSAKSAGIGHRAKDGHRCKDPEQRI